MSATVNTLLEALPPFRDQWIVISDEQSIDDIIEQVLQAHRDYAPMYDRISSFFSDGSDEQIFQNLYRFTKTNLHYREETEDDQTTMTPAGILLHGSVANSGIDCKHFSGFIAGVLDGINRQRQARGQKKIDWRYRFASYRMFDQTPHHVFVVVKNGIEEIYIDPTPMAEGLQPTWYTDKKVAAHTAVAGITENSLNMALTKNIAGTNSADTMTVATPNSYETFEVPAGVDWIWKNGEWHYQTPHKVGGISIGQGDIISTGLAIISNITKLFGSGGTGSRAAQKIFQMFPLPSTPTVQNMTDLLNAIVVHENNDVGLDSEWIAAFRDIKTQYQNLINALKSGTALPPIVVPPVGTTGPVNPTYPGGVYTGVPGTYSPPPATGGISIGLIALLAVGAYFLLKPKRA